MVVHSVTVELAPCLHRLLNVVVNALTMMVAKVPQMDVLSAMPELAPCLLRLLNVAVLARTMMVARAH